MEQYVLYLLIVTITISSPGPGVILTLSNSIQYGIKPAMAGVLGISLGVLAISIVSATSLGVLLSTSAIAFTILKYVGAVYLIYLGVKLWRSPTMKLSENTDDGIALPQKPEYALRFKEGFLVSVLNPKAIFFFMSLFPQFINPEQNYLIQFSYLTLTFCGMLVLIHSLYTLGANSIKGWLLSEKGSKTVNKVGGSVFVLFGFGLATSHR